MREPAKINHAWPGSAEADLCLMFPAEWAFCTSEGPLTVGPGLCRLGLHAPDVGSLTSIFPLGLALSATEVLWLVCYIA